MVKHAFNLSETIELLFVAPNKGPNEPKAWTISQVYRFSIIFVRSFLRLSLLS